MSSLLGGPNSTGKPATCLDLERTGISKSEEMGNRGVKRIEKGSAKRSRLKREGVGWGQGRKVGEGATLVEKVENSQGGRGEEERTRGKRRKFEDKNERGDVASGGEGGGGEKGGGREGKGGIRDEGRSRSGRGRQKRKKNSGEGKGGGKEDKGDGMG